MTRNGAHRTLQDRRLAELSNSKRTAKNPRPKPKRDFFNRIGRSEAVVVGLTRIILHHSVGFETVPNPMQTGTLAVCGLLHQNQ